MVVGVALEAARLVNTLNQMRTVGEVARRDQNESALRLIAAPLRAQQGEKP